MKRLMEWWKGKANEKELNFLRKNLPEELQGRRGESTWEFKKAIWMGVELFSITQPLIGIKRRDQVLSSSVSVMILVLIPGKDCCFKTTWSSVTILNWIPGKAFLGSLMVDFKLIPGKVPPLLLRTNCENQSLQELSEELYNINTTSPFSSSTSILFSFLPSVTLFISFPSTIILKRGFDIMLLFSFSKQINLDPSRMKNLFIFL